MARRGPILFRQAWIAACSAGLLSGAALVKAQDFDPFADPFAPFAPVVQNVAKEGIVTGNIGTARWPLENLPQISNFEVIGHNKIPNPGDRIARGRNGFLAIAESGADMGGGNIANTVTCAYVGQRVGNRTGTGDALGGTGGGQFGATVQPARPPERCARRMSERERP